MILLKNFINIFRITELRKKLLFTLGVLIVHRFGAHIPVIGIDIYKLHQLIEQSGGLSGALSYIDLFTGGSLSRCTLFALGITPYITASIMMQILSMSIPTLEQLSKEGELGRKVINQYTRYLALCLSIVQSFGYSLFVERSGLVVAPGWGFRFLFVLSITVGSMFVMWLGEQISIYGIGNGSSMIIFAGIIARFPDDFIKLYAAVVDGYMDPVIAGAIILLALAITAGIVFFEKGYRKIPVQYSRRIVGQRVYGGQSTYIPFKINPVGVMPVIMANSILNAPVFLFNTLSSWIPALQVVSDSLRYGGVLHTVLIFLLIIFFSFFYAALIFNPEELASNIKKSGGFIPGIRPGKKTAEYFAYILNRLGLAGAIYIGFLAILPTIIHAMFALPVPLNAIMSGTSLLIAVGVALEMSSQIESYLIEHRYEGFLSSGSLSYKRGR